MGTLVWSLDRPVRRRCNADDHPPLCPPAPGPLDGYAQRFDPPLSSLAQRRGLRDYPQGLLLPRDRTKTLTCLADAEPITGAQHRQVQRLQWFVSESTWDHEAVNQQRIGLLQADPTTAPGGQGVLVIGDTGDRKAGRRTAHVARQYLGRSARPTTPIVAVTSLWADPRCYWPLHLVPYRPASRLARARPIRGFGPSPSWPPPPCRAVLGGWGRRAAPAGGGHRPARLPKLSTW